MLLAICCAKDGAPDASYVTVTEAACGCAARFCATDFRTASKNALLAAASSAEPA